MVYINKQGGTTQYGVIEYVADTASDLATIDIKNWLMGSTCIVIDTSSVYMLGSDSQWHEL